MKDRNRNRYQQKFQPFITVIESTKIDIVTVFKPLPIRCLRILMIITAVNTLFGKLWAHFRNERRKERERIDREIFSLAKVSARYPSPPPTVPVSFGFGITLPQRWSACQRSRTHRRSLVVLRALPDFQPLESFLERFLNVLVVYGRGFWNTSLRDGCLACTLVANQRRAEKNPRETFTTKAILDTRDPLLA